MRKILVFLVVNYLILTGCSGSNLPEIHNNRPFLKIENYFAGKTKAWGIFEDRFGTVKRQFHVDITGTWDGSELMLEEFFIFDDGETDERVWRIKKINNHTYEGKANDILGKAKGQSFGNAFNWQYEMTMEIGSLAIDVHFDDWMFLQSEKVLINRAEITKLGIKIGVVTLFFIKDKSL